MHLLLRWDFWVCVAPRVVQLLVRVDHLSSVFVWSSVFSLDLIICPLSWFDHLSSVLIRSSVFGLALIIYPQSWFHHLSSVFIWSSVFCLHLVICPLSSVLPIMSSVLILSSIFCLDLIICLHLIIYLQSWFDHPSSPEFITCLLPSIGPLSWPWPSLPSSWFDHLSW